MPRAPIAFRRPPANPSRPAGSHLSAGHLKCSARGPSRTGSRPAAGVPARLHPLLSPTWTQTMTQSRKWIMFGGLLLVLGFLAGSYSRLGATADQSPPASDRLAPGERGDLAAE